MENDIRNIIKDWSESVDIWTPLPLSDQPNYNELMKEFTGDIEYNKQVDLPIEVRRPSGTQLSIDNAGDKFIQKLIFCIPYIIDEVNININDESILITNSDSNRYRILAIRYEFGEYIVETQRIVGGISG